LKTTQKTKERILALIVQKPTITQNDLATHLGDITPSGVKYNLKKLKSKGIINRIGQMKGGKRIYLLLLNVQDLAMVNIFGSSLAKRYL
jgi:predicted HTH transcriptional regulator